MGSLSGHVRTLYSTVSSLPLGMFHLLSQCHLQDEFAAVIGVLVGVLRSMSGTGMSASWDRFMNSCHTCVYHALWTKLSSRLGKQVWILILDPSLEIRSSSLLK